MTQSSSDRIVVQLQARIAAAPHGAQLPSTRELVAEFGASPVTVQRALRRLAERGVVEARPGVGTFVRRAPAARPQDFGWQTAALGSPRHRVTAVPPGLRTAPDGAIVMHSGYPEPALLPDRLLRAAFARVGRGESALVRPPTAGLPELRAWFARELAAGAPPGFAPPAADDVVVLPGSQSGLSTIFRALVGADEPLLIESPTYWGAMLAAQQTGVELVPVPSGPHGPDPADIERAFAETGARAFYAQPNFANPTGARWSAERADAVLRIVRERGAFLIEDDWAHDFGIDADAVPLAARDDGGHTIYLRSLTKSVSPAVRVAAVIARGPARERILADAGAHAMYVSTALQAVALEVVTGAGWRGHLRGLRAQLRQRRDLLVDAVHERLPSAHLETVPLGGLHLWARLPDGTDLRALVRGCEERGVLVGAGDDWFPAEPAGRYLRLNYSGPNPAAYPAGVERIAAALDAR